MPNLFQMQEIIFVQVQQLPAVLNNFTFGFCITSIPFQS